MYVWVLLACLQVRVTDSVDSGDDESTIYADDILEIQSVEAPSSSRSGFIEPVLIAINSFGEKLRLPPDTPGKFSALLDVKWYSMTEIVTKAEFPVRVQQVHSHPGYQLSVAEKLTIFRTSLSKNVLVTVNKELLAMPVDTEIEVVLKDDFMELDLPPPTDDLVAASGSSEKLDAENLPPPPEEVLDAANVDSTREDSSLLQQPSHVALPPPSSPKVKPRNADRKGSGPGSRHRSLLTEIDNVRLRLGSVRTFGTSKRLSRVSMHEDLASPVQPKPEEIRGTFRNLQERTAEMIRLQEESNKWQARCQRLNTHFQAARKQLNILERTEVFWRHKATNGTDNVDPATQKLLDEYQYTVEDSDLVSEKPSQPQLAMSDSPSISRSVPIKDLSFATLPMARVQELLEALNMAQYKEKFAYEQIDGGLLLELDEESLETEVGMKSALHRKKILRTISGKGQPLLELLKA